MGEAVALQSFWTFETVKDALVEAAELWRRSPGGGTSPFATDGPWQQMTREAWEYDARGGDMEEAPIRPLPLTRAQIARRDRVSEWLGHIESEEDRRLVVVAVGYLQRGHKRVPWRKIKHRMRIRFGEDGLRKRFERALSAICNALNAAEKRR